MRWSPNLQVMLHFGLSQRVASDPSWLCPRSSRFHGASVSPSKIIVLHHVHLLNFRTRRHPPAMVTRLGRDRHGDDGSRNYRR